LLLRTAAQHASTVTTITSVTQRRVGDVVMMARRRAAIPAGIASIRSAQRCVHGGVVAHSSRFDGGPLNARARTTP
jgi:hypothetical protein